MWGKVFKVKQINTIGHSTYDVDDFISLLKRNKIDTIVDVRSTRYSRFASQFNKEYIQHILKANNIYYIFMGDLLGARYKDKTLLFEDGKVNFKKVQQTESFQEGIKRLEKGIEEGYNISLMCSEKEAFDCHRFGLISEYLSKKSIKVNHIYPDKVLSQEELEKELLKRYDVFIPKANLFDLDITEDLQLELAYKFRNEDIAYNAITEEGDDE